MNKRDLIKALFKDPTIKALYESGHFNPTDINRAILTEASDIEEAKAGKFSKIGKSGTLALKLRNNIGVNTAGRAIRHLKDKKDPSKVEAAIEKLKKYPEGFNTEQAKGHETMFQQYVAFQINRLEKELQIFQAAQKAEKTNDSDKKTKAAAAKQNLDKKVDNAEKKVDQALDAAPDGDKQDSSNSEETGVKIEELSSAFDRVFTDGLDFIEAPERLSGATPQNYVKTGKPLIEKMKKAIVMDVFATPDITSGKANLAISQAFVKVQKNINQEKFPYITRELVTPDAFRSAIVDSFDTLKQTYNEKISSEPQPAAKEVEVSQEMIDKLEALLKKTEGLLDLVNKYPEFKKLLAVAYVKALSNQEKEEGSETSTTPPNTPQTPEIPTTATDAPEPELQTSSSTQESINRALRGIFLMENTDSTEASVEPPPTDTDPNTGSNGEGGGQISVDEATKVEKMLKDLETVFTAANLEIDVKTIWDLSQKKESEPEKEVDPEEDVSPPDLAEFQEKWTEELQTFFGKNPKKSSFMRRLLLSSQAEMLYKVLATLEEIADPAKMAALTDMNQDDEKENQAEEEVKSQLQEYFKGASLKIPSSEDESEVDAEQDPVSRLRPRKPWVDFVNRGPAPPSPGDPGYVDPEESQDKVELPAENKRIIKQDLQSMVDLLRQVKKAISSYSKYSTQKSVDPRFDGSKLKANMDDLLTQVQDDIYDLYSNLKPAAPKATTEPQGEGENIEEALNGIMLEEADPERQEQIKFVREVYDKAKEEYIYALATSMEGGEWSKSQQSAKDILKILKDDKFISLFPTGMKTASGRVMTVGKAYEVMKEMIQDFIETVRDIVLISKTKYISTPSLTQARNNLLQISTEIADLFQVASKFPAKEIKKAKEVEAANPANKALTPAPEEELEQGSEDNGSTVEDPATTDVEGEGREEEEPPIQPFFNAIFTQNQRETPNKEIIERIEAKFPDEEDQIKAKQIFSYFLLYFLPKKLDEQQEEEEENDFFDTMTTDDPVYGFVKKFIDNSQTPPALKDFLKDKKQDFVNEGGILRLKTPEEILDAAGNKLALFRTLGGKPAMQQFIASLKGDASAEAGGAKKEGEPEPEDVSTEKFFDDVFKGTSADTDGKDVAADASSNQTDDEMLKAIGKTIDTQMGDIDLKNFGGKKEIRDFWTWTAQTLGKLELKKPLEEKNYRRFPREYGKLGAVKMAAIKTAVATAARPFGYRGGSSFLSEDREHLRKMMDPFFRDIIESELPQEPDGDEFSPVYNSEEQWDRVSYVSRLWIDSLLEDSDKISIRKQFAPFMRYAERLEKNANVWYKSSSVAEIRAEFERIIKEKGLLDYIMKSTHNPYPDEDQKESLEKALRPIIEKMLKEHYNH